MVNKADGRAVPQFPSPGNPKCGHTHLVLIRHKPLRSDAYLLFSCFFFSFLTLSCSYRTYL